MYETLVRELAVDDQLFRSQWLEPGGSNKFWIVSAKGATVSVTLGRIGTPGQTKDKSYASGAAAIAAMQKLVEEKTGKGYVEA